MSEHERGPPATAQETMLQGQAIAVLLEYSLGKFMTMAVPAGMRSVLAPSPVTMIVNLYVVTSCTIRDEGAMASEAVG